MKMKSHCMPHPKSCRCHRCLRVAVYTTEDFYRDATPCSLFKDVQDQINKEESHKLIDESALRRDQTWSLLANQVMGAEVIPPFAG